MNRKLIGLSLSLCVKDILEKRVDIEEVLFIISGTMITDEDSFIKVMDRYFESYWEGFPRNIIEDIIISLFLRGVLQPRLFSIDPINISDGYWIEVTDNKVKDFMDELNSYPKLRF